MTPVGGSPSLLRMSHSTSGLSRLAVLIFPVFIAAVGLRSEIDILDGKSVSCHGQGVVGQWSPMKVTLEPKAE